MKKIKTYKDSVTNKSTNVFAVGAGTFTFKQWIVGTERKDKSSVKAELFWDQVGDGKHLFLLDTIYTEHGSYQKPFPTNPSFAATTNSKVVVKRTVLGKNGPREVHVTWAGDLV